MAGIFFSAAVNAASVSPTLNDATFTLLARSTQLDPLQPPINHPVMLDGAGNAIVNLEHPLNMVVRVLLAKQVLTVEMGEQG